MRSKSKLIANLGDVNPFEYGGYLIFKTPYGYQGVYWDSPGSDDEPVLEYRFDIDKDVFDDHSWAEPEKIASFVGADVSDLIEEGKSSNVLERAQLLRDIGSYYGFDNLDSYPNETTVRDLKKSYSRALSGLYKRERK